MGSAVQDQLKNVQKIQASSGAFASIRADGSVVTWGKPEEGGDSSAMQELLKDVQATAPTNWAQDDGPLHPRTQDGRILLFQRKLTE